MYTVTLKNVVLPGLEINGDYFVAPQELDADLFTNNSLAEVQVTNEETGAIETMTDAQLVDFHIRRGHTFFCIREKTDQQKVREQLAVLEQQGVERDRALMELAAMLAGGV